MTIDPKELKQLVRQLKALANENRLALYLEILEHERLHLESESCNCLISEIATKLSIGAPTISHYIKTLEHAGIIETQKQGKFITASINQDARSRAMHFFKSMPKPPSNPSSTS